LDCYLKEDKKLFCPACGYENLPGVDYCQECLSNLSHLDLTRKAKTESRIEKAILKERAYQILSPPSISVSEDTSVQSVLELMYNNSKTAVVIENDKSDVAGIFTERSFVRRVAKSFPAVKDEPVKNYMAKNPVIINSTDKIVNILHHMFVAGYSYAIIDEKPHRIISIVDILKYVIELYPSLAGFDKLMDDLKSIALADGVITKDESFILKKIEEKKESFLRIIARIEATGSNVSESDREMLESLIDEFIPSVEEAAAQDHHITPDETELLRKLFKFFEENRDRFFL